MVIVHKVWGKGTKVVAGGKVYTSSSSKKSGGGGGSSSSKKAQEKPIFTGELPQSRAPEFVDKTLYVYTNPRGATVFYESKPADWSRLVGERRVYDVKVGWASETKDTRAVKSAIKESISKGGTAGERLEEKARKLGAATQEKFTTARESIKAQLPTEETRSLIGQFRQSVQETATKTREEIMAERQLAIQRRQLQAFEAGEAGAEFVKRTTFARPQGLFSLLPTPLPMSQEQKETSEKILLGFQEQAGRIGGQIAAAPDLFISGAVEQAKRFPEDVKYLLDFGTTATKEEKQKLVEGFEVKTKEFLETPVAVGGALFTGGLLLLPIPGKGLARSVVKLPKKLGKTIHVEPLVGAKTDIFIGAEKGTIRSTFRFPMVKDPFKIVGKKAAAPVKSTKPASPITISEPTVSGFFDIQFLKKELSVGRGKPQVSYEVPSQFAATKPKKLSVAEGLKEIRTATEKQVTPAKFERLPKEDLFHPIGKSFVRHRTETLTLGEKVFTRAQRRVTKFVEGFPTTKPENLSGFVKYQVPVGKEQFLLGKGLRVSGKEAGLVTFFVPVTKRIAKPLGFTRTPPVTRNILKDLAESYKKLAKDIKKETEISTTPITGRQPRTKLKKPTRDISRPMSEADFAAFMEGEGLEPVTISGGLISGVSPPKGPRIAPTQLELQPGKFRFEFKELVKPATAQRFKLEQKQLLKTQQKEKQGLVIGLKSLVVQRTGQRPITVQRPRQGQRIELIQITKQPLKTKLTPRIPITRIPGRPPRRRREEPKPPRIKPPIPIPLPIPKRFPILRKKKRKPLIKGVRKGYSPSLLGIISGKRIRKPPRLVSGVGIRRPLKRRKR